MTSTPGSPEGPPVFAVIAAGGTGGHVVPGLAVAHVLAGRGHGLHWIGSERGLEARLVPAAGVPITLLAGRGFERRLSRENVRSARALAGALRRAAAVLRRLQPQVVVALGGWASFAAAVAALRAGVPVVVMEQNAVPGLANRLVARRARAAAVAFPGTALPRAVVTGNPVRDAFAAADRSPGGRAAAREALGVPAGRRLVGVSGGSLGALRLNQATVEARPSWHGRTDLAVYHVIGERDWERLGAGAPPAGDDGLWYRPVRYEDRMDLLLTAADVMVQRAGGTTVAELAAVGVPSVLVPLPSAPGDHQTANARHLVDAGGAVLVADADLDSSRLVAEVDGLLAHPGRLDAMGAAAASLGRPRAAAAVADLVERYARRA